MSRPGRHCRPPPVPSHGLQRAWPSVPRGPPSTLIGCGPDISAAGGLAAAAAAAWLVMLDRRASPRTPPGGGSTRPPHPGCRHAGCDPGRHRRGDLRSTGAPGPGAGRGMAGGSEVPPDHFRRRREPPPELSSPRSGGTPRAVRAPRIPPAVLGVLAELFAGQPVGRVRWRAASLPRRHRGRMWAGSGVRGGMRSSRRFAPHPVDRINQRGGGMGDRRGRMADSARRDRITAHHPGAVCRSARHHRRRCPARPVRPDVRPARCPRRR